MEKWKEIGGYEGYYWVSNYGRIKSLKGVRRVSKNNQGYPMVLLCVKGKKKSFTVHRLVAKAFVDNPFGYDCVNHKDNNPENNYYENLEWCTMSYNTKYAIEQQRFTHHIKNCEENNLKRQIKVGQFSMSGTLLNTYNSMSEASKAINTTKASISKCCNEKIKSVNGYIFKKL